MIGMLTFINPPKRRGARVRSRRKGSTAREGKEKVMARKRVRRRGRRVRRAMPRVIRRRRRVSSVRRRRGGRRRRRLMLANPLFRSRRSGRFKGRPPGKRLRRRRRAPHYWHLNNPPVRRRRRRSSGGRRRVSRRRYRRNPVATGRRRISLKDPVGAVMNVVKEAFSRESIETAIQGALGFGGALGGSKLVYRNLFPFLDTQIGRPATALAVTIAETLLGGWIGGPRFGARVLVGGLIGTLWQGVSEAARGTKAADFIPLLGEGPEDEAFRRAIEQEVLRELRGGEDGMSVYLRPAGVQYVPPAGASAYLTGREAHRLEATGVNAYMTQRELDRASGMGDAEGEFSAASAPERF